MNQQEQQLNTPVLKPEARKALDAAVTAADKDRPSLAAPSMNRIHRAVASIPLDRLRLMMADGRVSSQETRMALSQAGLSTEEVELALEYTRRILENYARNVVTSEQSLSSIGELLNQKVKKFGAMIASGTIMPVMKKQPKGEAVTPSTAGVAREPEGKKLY